LFAGSNPDVGPEAGTTSYLGCAGYTGKFQGPGGNKYDALAGIFYNRSKITAQRVRDGLSHTIFFGETNGVFGSDTERFPHNWLGCGVMWTRATMLYTNGSEHFNSDHGEVVNFSFADGSTKSLERGIDGQVRIKLSSAANSEVVSPEDY